MKKNNISLIIIQAIIFLLVVFYHGCKDNGISVGPPTPLPEYISIDDAPSWSHQGDRIAYFHFNRNRNDSLYPTGLYIIDTNGQNRRLVIEGFAYNPDWSPDGSHIVFNSGELYTIRVDGKNLFQVTNVSRAYFPSWSPDGSKIAFDTQYQDPNGAIAIWIINSDGTGLRDISQHGTGEWRNPDWSPDGRSIIHYRYIGIGTSEIFVMDSSGKSPYRLTSNNYFDFYPKYSPDGKRIAWTSGKNIDEIWIMNSDGTNQFKLTQGEKPSWSPDGKKIVYSKAVGDKIALFIFELGNGKITQLTN